MHQEKPIRMVDTEKTIAVFWPTFVAGFIFYVCAQFKIEQNWLTVSLGIVGALVYLIIQCIYLSRSFDSTPIEYKTAAKPATWDNPPPKKLLKENN